MQKEESGMTRIMTYKKIDSQPAEQNESNVKRDALYSGDKISLTKYGTESDEQTFTIIEEMGSGGSLISYKVEFESADCNIYNYVLKEVYPLPVSNDEDLWLKRKNFSLEIDKYDENPKTKGHYKYCRERYRNAYNLQISMSNGIDNDAVLNQTTSVPVGLYEDRNSSSCGNYALYALFQYNVGTVYSEFTDKELSDLIDTQLKIATVVSSYHNHGFLWLDIKESNIYIVGKDSLKSVMMFDFDSLLIADTLKQYKYEKNIDPNFVISFSPTSKNLLLPRELESLAQKLSPKGNELFKDFGIIEEDINMLGKYGCVSDIFLLGSLFFKRLFGTAPTQEDCTNIQENRLIPESRFIDGYPGKVKDKIINILKNTLNYEQTGKRYPNIQNLINDLKDLLNEVNKTDEMEKRKTDSALRAVYQHMVEYPLYRSKPYNKESDVNISILGFGKCAKIFLDTALQIMQIPNKRINILISASEQEKNQYLSQRPSLEKFFIINDSEIYINHSYGNINFTNNGFENKEVMLSEMLKSADYVFIDYDNCEKNILTAKAISENVDFSNIFVSYAVTEDNYTNLISSENIVPVDVRVSETKTDIYNELERMALNVHLVWKTDFNIDDSQIMEEFYKPYNYSSCILYAVSLKYKLYAIGIDMKNGNFEKAAAEFMKKRSTIEQYNELVWYEHRRWVAEKICDGYSAISNPEKCLNGNTKDSAAKEHICLQESENDYPLNEWTPNDWDSPTEEMLQKLDKLDRTSVELHLMYMRHAEKIRNSDVLNAAEIQKQIDEDKNAVMAFKRWYSCAKEIFDGNDEQVNYYEGLKNALISDVQKSEQFTEAKRNVIINMIKSFNENFYPIYAARICRNYKKYDEELVKSIPFILTYSKSICLAVPYVIGENSFVNFRNIASSAAVNPSEIIYCFYGRTSGEIYKLNDSLAAIYEFMDRKKIRASLELIIGGENSCINEIKMASMSIMGRRLKNVDVSGFNDINEFAEYVKERLHGYKAQKGFMAFEQNDDELSAALKERGISEHIPCFCYDSVNLVFNNIKGCEILTYIDKQPHITVSEMLLFMNIEDNTYQKSEFYVKYKDLWNRYRMNSSAWKMMNSILKTYTENNDIIYVFEKCGVHEKSENYRYIIPFICRKAVSEIIDVLICNGFIENDSTIFNLNSDSCEVYISEKHNLKKVFDSLFSQLHKLMLPDYIKCRVEDDGRVSIIYDNLKVCGLYADDKNVTELIQYFSDNGYIINLATDADKHTLSFSFATKQIKKLMTDDIRIPEVYIYNMLKETGDYNDIRSGIMIDLEKIDCIITKGFSSLFVYYRYLDEIDDDLYARKAYIADKYGINAQSVIITDGSDYDSCQISNYRNIFSVFGQSDIDNIGNVLVKLLK